MKVYVDELPKSCIDCPCESEYYCNLLNRDIEFLELTKGCKDCPLQSLADYTKQVRKEVCEQVNDYMESHSYTITINTKNRKVVYKIGLTRFLDQIQ